MLDLILLEVEHLHEDSAGLLEQKGVAKYYRILLLEEVVEKFFVVVLQSLYGGLVLDGD